MRLEPVPLLRVLRELWTMPRDMARFNAYLQKVTGGPEVVVPLIAANPMAREHMVAYVDALEAFDAERVVAEACVDASRRLAHVALDRKLSLVPVDDVRGAWSERTLMDFEMRGGARKVARKYPYVTAVVYASETPTPRLVRERVLAAAYRAAWAEARAEEPETVRAMMRREGNALRFAGTTEPRLDDAAAARAVLAPHLDATLHATRFAAMYGDDAASRVGHKPLGLPADAGFALALEDAMRQRERPEDLLV